MNVSLHTSQEPRRLLTYGNVIGKRSNRSGSHDLSSSGTSGDHGEERSMPPAWSTSTATRRPWETTSLKKFIVLGQVYFISVFNTQSIIIFRKISRNYCIRVVHALGVARTLYAAPRGAVKHVVTVRRRSSSYATMFQTEAQQATPECQQSVLVKREVIRRM